MSAASKKHSVVLTIAGSDSGGGAGIQADLKTFSALGCYGMSAITAVTAQNTCGVIHVAPLQTKTVKLQIKAVLEDIGADAIKIGMLGNSSILRAVKEELSLYPEIPIVLDPVMFSKSGDSLFEGDMKELFSEVTLITPNLLECEILVGYSLLTLLDVEKAGKDLLKMGLNAALIKGGHLEITPASDYFTSSEESFWLKGSFIETSNTHGTGCTHSSAIAAFLARGETLKKAVFKAKNYIQNALQAGSQYRIGKGYGPVHHFWEHPLWF